MLKQQTHPMARACLAMLLLSLMVAAPAQAAKSPVNGVSPIFASYWSQHGGLPIFGLPLGDSRKRPKQITNSDGVFLYQLFERTRMEWHPENAPPYHVLLGRMGVEILERQGRDWTTFPKGDPSAAHYFSETGHAIAEVFWPYWSTHGLEFGDPGASFRESLALFGMPLSEPQMETNSSGDTVLTQWFERARFEHHPKNPPEFQVLLGRLGAEWQVQPNGSTMQLIAPPDGSRVNTIAPVLTYIPINDPRQQDGPRYFHVVRYSTDPSFPPQAGGVPYAEFRAHYEDPMRDAYADENLLPNTTYYWKVEAIAENDQIVQTSPVWRFTTGNVTPEKLPAAPRHLGPPDGAVLRRGNVVLEWEPTPGANMKDVHPAPGGFFRGVTMAEEERRGRLDISYYFDPGEEFDWQVRERNSHGWGPWSDPWHGSVVK